MANHRIMPAQIRAVYGRLLTMNVIKIATEVDGQPLMRPANCLRMMWFVSLE
jgi:hypothetical protein